MRGEGLERYDHHPLPTFVELYYSDVVHVMMEGRVSAQVDRNWLHAWNRKDTPNLQKNSVTTIKKNYNPMTGDLMLS